MNNGITSGEAPAAAMCYSNTFAARASSPRVAVVQGAPEGRGGEVAGEQRQGRSWGLGTRSHGGAGLPGSHSHSAYVG